MAKGDTRPENDAPPPVISQIIVENFKSIVARQALEVRPLTVLAGANSSGKSSVMQAVLLLKQTLEATYDPGPLLLAGPNVTFTSADQLLSKSENNTQADQFAVGTGTRSGIVETHFRRASQKPGFYIEQAFFGPSNKPPIVLNESMTAEQVAGALPPEFQQFFLLLSGQKDSKPLWKLSRNRCLLQLALAVDSREMNLSFTGLTAMEKLIPGIVHLPGLRGNPSRSYPVTAVGENYPGTFEKYTASVISLWQTGNRADKLAGLNRDLEYLGLTCSVTAKAVNDTQVELQVGRLPHAPEGPNADTVNIADVGFGVSQVLPVLVALHAAESHHLVYLEQPEIHLHPRAQHRLAWVLAAAVKRGVRAVVETHSSILLLGLQTLVARSDLSPDLVKLHWFTREKDGRTQVSPADLDQAGAFGQWPEDFAETNLEAESAYLDAAEPRMFSQATKR